MMLHNKQRHYTLPLRLMRMLERRLSYDPPRIKDWHKPYWSFANVDLVEMQIKFYMRQNGGYGLRFRWAKSRWICSDEPYIPRKSILRKPGQPLAMTAIFGLTRIYTIENRKRNIHRVNNEAYSRWAVAAQLALKNGHAQDAIRY